MEQLEIAALDLKRFRRPVFFAGAGISVESGIPTYRGAGGVWKDYNYHDYACEEAFQRDPEKVWDFHDRRREMISRCAPNAGHRIIAAVQHRQPETVIITQNIDGLHQRAGGERVIELHGSIWRLRAPEVTPISGLFDLCLRTSAAVALSRLFPALAEALDA